MTDHSNPRKISESGGLTVVSIPPGFLEECGLALGDRVVLYPEDGGFRAREAEWQVVDDG